MIRVRSLAWILACLILAAPAAGEEFVRSVSVGDGERVRIDLQRGDVVVTRHAEPVLRIVAEARGTGSESVRFRLEERDGNLVFRSFAAPWLAWLRSGPRIAVRAWVPRDVPLEVKTTGRVERREPGVRVVYSGTGGR